MAFEQKDGQGSLWKNDRKEKDTHPDLTGQIMVEGKMYWISGWAKVHESRGKWLSLSVKPKDQPTAQPSAKPADGDDSLPF